MIELAPLTLAMILAGFTLAGTMVGALATIAVAKINADAKVKIENRKHVIAIAIKGWEAISRAGLDSEPLDNFIIYTAKVYDLFLSENAPKCSMDEKLEKLRELSKALSISTATATKEARDNQSRET